VLSAKLSIWAGLRTVEKPSNPCFSRHFASRIAATGERFVVGVFKGGENSVKLFVNTY
jgi:hypothetical protein